ncbi:hypothetical protein GH5_06931 [Leishmania sp. Ghana 2012 LV757]|uniref:hypothetical protein n=1 Tax=Leishmania sp. Ghana 2012 LV757 TaxID=2803181 RepID=UPI001B5F5FDC|nr:hypothetical protein GH5_06931 [Leishmania sp. Ghana 2012 LV757]
MSWRVVTVRPSPVSGVRRASLPLLLLIALAVVGLSLQLPTPAAAQVSDYNDYYDGTYYYHVIFQSAAGGGDSVDGPSGVGKYGVVGYGGAMLDSGVVFSDMGGSGSAIRHISMRGFLSTIAGSLTMKGNKDGPATEALFSGIASGDSRSNSLVQAEGGFYLADTLNDALRLTDAATRETTTILNSTVLKTPNSLAVSVIDGKTAVFISNTGLHQVLFFPSLGSPVGQVNFTGDPYFVPGALAVVPQLSRTFIVNATLQMYCWYFKQPGSTSWKVSSPAMADFGRSLLASKDGTKLLYVTSNGTTLASMDATASSSLSPTLRPEKVADLDLAALGGKIQLFFQRSADSWYILTTTQFMIVSSTPIHSSSSSGSGSASSSGSGSASSSGSGSASGSSSSSGGSHSDRHEGIAAFPTNAFPINDSCLMTQVYFWMRADARVAYGSSDFENTFLVPPSNTTTLVKGDVNVSAWCGNITADFSHDSSILILLFWGPPDSGLWYTQDRLTTSPWSNTRTFLGTLKSSGWDLGPFCFFNCTTTCKNITAPMCPASTESACDDVCKGAIASSVVIAVAGILLVLMMIISPSNIFTAVVMVPII